MNFEDSDIKRQYSLILPFFILLFSLIFYFLIGGLALYLKDWIPPLAINGFAQIVALALPAFFANKYFDLKLSFFKSEKKFNSKNIFYLALLLFLIYLLNSAFGVIIQTIISKEKYNELYEFVQISYSKIFGLKSIYEYFSAIFFAAIVPAFVEEYFFRGFLLNSLLKSIDSNNLEKIVNKKTIIAFLLVSFIFALIHFNPLSFVMLFAFSLLLCLLTYKTNSLLPAIILHFINNLIVISVMFFSPQNLDIEKTQEPNVYIAFILIFFAIISSIHIIKKLRF